MIKNFNLDAEALKAAKQDLAACFRAAAALGFSEGICNHFSAVAPGSDELFIVNPFGLAFSEIRASDLLVCDFEGNVVQGDAKPEDTAFFIHSRIHKMVPRARVALHAHTPSATALSMVEGQPLKWAGQNALRFYGRTLVDDNYNGLALDSAEGDRIAASLGDAEIVFMRNHGVMVVGTNIAEAWDDLYYLERACEVQIRAEATGRVLIELSAELAEETYNQFRRSNSAAARAHFQSVKRCLDQTQPDYAA